MPRYRVNYGETFDFWGQDVGEVVPELRSRHLISDEDELSFMRRAAMEMCEWNGKNYYFQTRDALGLSMIENGLLEVID